VGSFAHRATGAAIDMKRVPTDTPEAIPRKVVADVLERTSLLRSRHQAVLDQMRRTLSQLRQRSAPPRSDARPARVALPRGTSPERLGREFHLTVREQEVAMLLSEGLSNAQVAQALGVSTHTARHHTESVLLKLGVHSRAAAGAVVRRYVSS
jgi:DNA-binding NarL/FixJ family response regulator